MRAVRRNASWDTRVLSLNKENQKILLRIARETLIEFTKGGTYAPDAAVDSALFETQGCFVTLKKGGRLRGCVGALEPEKPIFEEVARLARMAASEDSRFLPVCVEELDKIKIEISILSPLEPIGSFQEIEVGRHGVSVRWRDRSGVFLPEVAREMKWSAEQFVRACGREKAGLLEESAWSEAKLFRFTTEKIKE